MINLIIQTINVSLNKLFCKIIIAKLIQWLIIDK